MKKIKVAFCLRDMQLGGVESVLIRTLDELQKNKDIDISVITYVKIVEPVYVEYFKQRPNIKCEVLYPCSWLGTKLPHFFLWRLSVHLMRDIYRNTKRMFVAKKLKDIDVFIDYHDFGFHNELKRINNAKKIAWFHSSWNVFESRGFIKYLKYYDNFVVLTDDFKNEFIKKYPDYQNKILRIYNPIDIEQIKEKSKEKCNNIDGDYFCAVARLTPDKDIETIIRAFDLFWQKNNKPDIKMVFVGDGNRADYYKSVANNLPAKKQFVFAGAQSNPFGIMKGAIAHILSSYGEGMGLVLIESMIVGTINISSDCKCGPREILLNGDAGLLFEPGNIEQLAKCMDDIYNKKIDIKQMITKATKSLNRFDADKIVEQIISLIS
ncbi:MAG: glycosyltransferase [Alphaproteobacteria bacterium]|nr:glycosyltransferase [Alphaproteobacteria bacterium]